jgi:hypothetical protein
MQDPTRMNVVNSDDSFLVSDSEVLLFVVNGSTRKFLSLIRPEKQCSYLLLGGARPHTHEEVRIHSNYLVETFDKKCSDELALARSDTILTIDKVVITIVLLLLELKAARDVSVCCYQLVLKLVFLDLSLSDRDNVFKLGFTLARLFEVNLLNLLLNATDLFFEGILRDGLPLNGLEFHLGVDCGMPHFDIDAGSHQNAAVAVEAS